MAWLPVNHAYYDNGYFIPFSFGEKDNMVRVELRKPEYSLDGKNIKIKF